MLKQTVKKPIKPWKGSRFNNYFKTSDQIRSQTSHDCPWWKVTFSPNPLSHNFRETLHIAPPTRPSFLRHQSGYCRGKDLWWCCWRTGHRPRTGRDVSRGTSGWLVAKQKHFFFEKALHLHWKTDLKSRIDLFWPCFGTNGVWSKKTNPKLEATCAAWISHKKDTLCTNVNQ